MTHVSKHFPRIVTACCLISILAAALYSSGIYLFAVVLLFSLLGLWEFYSMFWSGTEALGARLVGLALNGLLFGVAWLRPELTMLSLAMITLALSCYFLFNWARNEAYRFTKVAVITFGLLYIPILLAPVLHFTTVEQVFLLATAMTSDTAAYFIGLHFGKHKIWPAVSPKKTLEGSAGGLLCCVTLCTLYGVTLGQAGAASFALLALVLGIVAQLGDFFESALKRSRSVKDSGSVLPGHGGVLDRIDSLLFIIPTYAFAKAFWDFF